MREEYTQWHPAFCSAIKLELAENKEDLVVISLEQYQREMFLNKLEKSKQQYKEGKVHSARTVFKGLREKYGY